MCSVLSVIFLLCQEQSKTRCAMQGLISHRRSCTYPRALISVLQCTRHADLHLAQTGICTRYVFAGYSLLVRVGESGEGMKGSRRNWSRKLVRATMVAGWENKVKGPWINHSCCAVHCNCEYVPTEFVRDRKGGSFSVNVRTTRDVKSTGGGPVEFLVDYGEDYLKVLGGKCRCCAHTRATAQCRFARAR